MSSLCQPPPCRTILVVNRAAQAAPITSPQARSTGWASSNGGERRHTRAGTPRRGGWHGTCAVMALERILADIRAQAASPTCPTRCSSTTSSASSPSQSWPRPALSTLWRPGSWRPSARHNFRVLFVCGCRDLGEALRRIREGAAIIRTKGEAPLTWPTQGRKGCGDGEKRDERAGPSVF
uniref:pyridoxal 5'-phosphate synthase (glutamine hydrolyzing) n=3 Tax=Oryza TaxID=4527 RepID=Q94HM9_ORYSJ|nr:Hypothetical protein with similarity to ethylene-responsive protein 1 from Para rubber tree [Oryza sativa Japonica Group]AAP52269.1 expressed protein [Oryza sativa Japonica Group]